ncbi:DDE-type integrase/transposase/recombinase [Streptomyces osmaniensis]|uniref:DDE-type integrase/transposase/recombinase n=1 Tax=Streptomyces osmaniensis TaxID=593134 RepID=UPI001C336102|nr:DDE-type integrase/transposase/recombinase [Streptomyces sp. JCM17656]
MYLATVIDFASRRLVGWALAKQMRTELVTDALAAAERTRGSLSGAIIPTDHGSAYTRQAFAEACRSAGVRQSMGRSGQARMMRFPNPSTQPLNAKHSRAERPGSANARPGFPPGKWAPVRVVMRRVSG